LTLASLVTDIPLRVTFLRVGCWRNRHAETIGNKWSK